MKKTMIRAVALSSVLWFVVAQAGFAAGGSIGYGDISVYKNDRLVTTLTGQNPVEDGALLECAGNCMVKSQGISLIGKDAAQFAVVGEDDNYKILLKEGIIDYAINSNARKITFYTPQGSYTIAEAVFNAAGSSAIKGSIIVGENGQTEITVTEGRLVYATADGIKTVDANQKIVLAQAVESAGAGEFTTTQLVIGGVVTAGIITAIVVAANDDDSSSPPPADDTPDSPDVPDAPGGGGGGTPPPASPSS
jgi:hypothetical protein